MQRENGNVVIWSSEQGSGLIRPTNGSKDVYLYAVNMRFMKRSPRALDHVTYLLDDADTDKPIARDVVICRFDWAFFVLLCLSVMPLIGLYLYGVRQHLVTYNPAVLAYVCISLLTILLYHHDKSAETTGAWRVPDKDLHVLELFGGWPGSLLSQLCFRHKLSNLSYQLVFWLIVIGHGVAWVFVLYGTSLCKFAKERSSEIAYGHVSELLTPVALSVAPSLVTEKPISTMPEPVSVPVPAPVARPAPVPVPVTSPVSIPVPPSPPALTNTPAEPLLSDPAAPRALVAAPKHLRRLTGEVTTVSPSLGIVVSLPQEIRADGIIAPSTLVADFSSRFRVGESVTVAIRRVIIKGRQKQVELLLVEQ